MHRIVVHHTRPSSRLDDHAPMSIIEEQVGPEFPAASDPSDAVSLVGKEMLEQNLELPSRHGVDGCHTGTLVCLALFRSPTTESSNAGDDERRCAQQEEGGANPGERGAEDKQDRTRHCNTARRMATQPRNVNRSAARFPHLGMRSGSVCFERPWTGAPARLSSARVGSGYPVPTGAGVSKRSGRSAM